MLQQPVLGAQLVSPPFALSVVFAPLGREAKYVANPPEIYQQSALLVLAWWCTALPDSG